MESFPTFRADLSVETLHGDRSLFFTQGVIDDQDVVERIRRLEVMYSRYLDLYPYGLWAPGLMITPEMRRVTEHLLPIGQIHSALQCFSRRALHFPHGAAIPFFNGATSWLDVVQCLPESVRLLNPARLLRLAACQESFRLKLLFSLHLPSQHGGSFGRYPEQAAFIRQWLSEYSSYPRGGLRCLDAACGTGEGTYELAMLLEESSVQLDGWKVHGFSADPLEIFSAAHLYFPHDPARQEELRDRMFPLGNSILPRVTFGVGDIITAPSGNERYDLILCNGILGGPLLHEREKVRAAVGLLSGQLVPGGLLLAADRFHAGWERVVPKQYLRQMFVDHGLSPVEPGNGMGGIKKAAA